MDHGGLYVFIIFKRIVVFLMVFWFLVMSIFIVPLKGEENQVYNGVSFNGHSLGGKKKAEVYALLLEVNKTMEAQQVVLYCSIIDKKIISNYREMGISVDKEKIWDQAVSIGRSGRWWKDLWKRWQLRKNPEEIPLQMGIDKEKMRQKLYELTLPWHQDPKDAELVIKKDDNIEIKTHEYGKEIDISAAAIELEESAALNSGGGIMVNIAFVPLKPAKLKSDIEMLNIKGLICKYRTKFNTARINRTHNIELAAKALDNCLIAPGAVFSFNDTVGPRTIEKGYDEADIILQNELVSGVGGGVCQVSTTLYNAVLHAELEIVERTPHTMLISYVSPGLDATVVYGYRDLKFRNTTKGCLIIKTSIYQGNLEVKIYGMPVKERKVVVKSTKEKEIPPQTIFREDSHVPKGKYILERAGQKGYIYKVERYIYDAQGKLLNQELISRDYYPPVDQIIKTAAIPSLLSYYNIL